MAQIEVEHRGVLTKKKFDELKLFLKKNGKFLGEKNPQNAYEVQECARKVMLNLKSNTNILSKLQNGAFNTGVDVDSVLFTGSLYLRDLALPKFNFKVEDIDNHKPSA